MYVPFALLFVLNVSVCLCEIGKARDFPGTAELLPSNGRRSRLSRDFVPSPSDPSPIELSAVAATTNTNTADAAIVTTVDDEQASTEKLSKLSDDTVREYGHLLQMDTKNFSEKQKALLERIVERVARLSGSVGVESDDLTNANEGRGSKNRLKKNSLKSSSQTKPDGSTPVPDSVKVTLKASAGKPLIVVPVIADLKAASGKQRHKLHAASVAAVNANGGLKGQNVTEVIFGNITTSSIVDSLSADNVAREDIYVKKRPSSTAATAVDATKVKKEPAGPAKPTKYHYYPHNQHIYLLPECAIQQVCNAVYVRLNYTQPLCACPSRYRDPCSASINEDDLHTTKLVGDGNKKAITLAKTCESTTEMRECRSPRDWSLLALQNTRTGKSHYLVICRCPDNFILEGPMAHDQPTYASVPGIRVFGMMCVKPGAVNGGGGGAKRKNNNQAPKRDHPYQQHHSPQSYSQQQPQTNYQQIPSQSYHQPQQPQQSQYQTNYQYLHRSPSDRPFSTSTSRSIYHNNNKVTHNNQYDDVYARIAGAGSDIEAVTSNGGSSSSIGDNGDTPSAAAFTATTTTTESIAPSTQSTTTSLPSSSLDDKLSSATTEAEVTASSSSANPESVQNRSKRSAALPLPANIDVDELIQQLLRSELADHQQPPHPFSSIATHN